LTDESLR